MSKKRLVIIILIGLFLWLAVTILRLYAFPSWKQSVGGWVPVIWESAVEVAFFISIIAGILEKVGAFRDNKYLKPMNKNQLFQNLPRSQYIGGKFINRTNEIEEIKKLIREDHRPIIGITGIGGVGKSELALYIARYYAEKYTNLKDKEKFNAIIWVTAKLDVLTDSTIVEAETPAKTLLDIYQVIANTLERKEILTVDVHTQADLVKKELDRIHTLLIIDNLDTFYDKSVISFYLNLPKTTKVIVTSRFSIDAAYPIRLDGLSNEHAVEYTKRVCAEKKVEIDEKSIATLTERTGGIPIAINWSVGQIAQQKSFDVVLKEMPLSKDKLVQYCFSGSVNVIRDTDAYKILMAISLFFPDASKKALGIVAGIENDAVVVDDAISKLYSMSLVMSNENNRFNVHTLTKNFAREELRANKDVEIEYKKRFEDYMQGLILEKVGKDYWAPITHWLESKGLAPDIDNLMQCVEWTFNEGKYDHVLSIGGVLVHHLWRLGRVEERIEICKKVVYAAQQLGEHEWEVWLLVDGLGYIYITRGDWGEARKIILEGESVAKRYNLEDGRALALTWLAYMAVLQKQFEDAEKYFALAQDLAQKPMVKGRLRFVEGCLALARKDYAEAERKFLSAIDFRHKSDGYEPPSLLAYLGVAQALQNKTFVAGNTLNRAINHDRPSVEGAAYAKFGLAIVEAEEYKNIQKAELLATEALETLERIGGEIQTSQIKEFLEKIMHQKKARTIWQKFMQKIYSMRVKTL
jgi:tetratricopeptide (TPR) repeat protein